MFLSHIGTRRLDGMKHYYLNVKPQPILKVQFVNRFTFLLIRLFLLKLKSQTKVDCAISAQSRLWNKISYHASLHLQNGHPLI